VNSQGGGTVTERGAVWNTSGNPTVNSNRVPSGFGTGGYSINITGLTGGGNNYYVRAYAINNYGIAYGAELTFATLFGLATLTTNNVFTQSTTASSGGNITDAGGSSIIARGVVWGTSSGPTITGNKTTDGTGTGSFVCNLTGLTPSTTYYLRAYATNNTGTAYGNELSFTTTATSQLVTDIDGNTYNTVQIGTQVWMSENLKTTRYNNGNPIPYVLGNTDWVSLTTGAWNYLFHNEVNNLLLGKLYNGYALDNVMLCPIGWHIPSNAEWKIMIDFLGGQNISGRKMRSVTWNGTNESGFSGLPGYRRTDYGFDGIGSYYYGIWWSSNVSGNSRNYFALADYTDFVYLPDGDINFIGGFSMGKNQGASVRCLKD
jgi:uncharacterized protein (TIGR02145 family)